MRRHRAAALIVQGDEACPCAPVSVARQNETEPQIAGSGQAMTKPAASNSGPRCQKLRRRSSWTVDEARKFLETSRSDDDPLYPLWVLIVVLGLRKGEALGLIWPEDDDAWPAAGDDGAELPLEWQLQRVAATRSPTSTS